MRFIVTVTPAPNAKPADPHAPFDEKLFVAHMQFNEEMCKAGVLLASEGLNPSARGAHVLVSGAERRVLDGPFAETKELVGGFYLLDVGSLEEAIGWAKRYPGGGAGDEVMEVRQLTGAGDLPPELVTLIERAAPTWSAAFKK